MRVRIFFLSAAFGLVCACVSHSEDVSYTAVAPGKGFSKTNVFVTFSEGSDVASRVADILSFDLEFPGKFKTRRRALDYDAYKKFLEKDNRKALFKSGVDIAAFVEASGKPGKKGQKVSVTARSMANGKTLASTTQYFLPANFVANAHKVSADALKALTGNSGVCTSTIAWSEGKDIFIGDYACMQAVRLIESPGKKFTLSWHQKEPKLFFSQETEKNSRLMEANLKGKERICFSYPGLNMQFSPSDDGKKAFVCLTADKGNTELFLFDEKVCKKVGQPAFKQLTKNSGTNVSPCYLSDGNMVFCSDYEYKRPQIYFMDIKRNKSCRITFNQPYCASPTYCAKTNKIVYVSPVEKVFQLFSLDLDDLKKGKAPTTKQLTFSKGDKLSPSLHESGEFVSFVTGGRDDGGELKSQLAIYNLLNNQVKIMSKGRSDRRYPAWTERQLYAL
ncbi:hypothetical protein HOD08_03555 [bacterium]|nr:hypothetical protein [bacterium]